MPNEAGGTELKKKDGEVKVIQLDGRRMRRTGHVCQHRERGGAGHAVKKKGYRGSEEREQRICR